MRKHNIPTDVICNAYLVKNNYRNAFLVQPIDYYETDYILADIQTYLSLEDLHIEAIDQGFLISKYKTGISDEYTDQELGKILGFPCEGIPDKNSNRMSVHLYVQDFEKNTISSIISFICLSGSLESKAGVKLCYYYKSILDYVFENYKFTVTTEEMYNLEFIYNEYAAGRFHEEYERVFVNECSNAGIKEDYINEILLNGDLMLILLSYFIEDPSNIFYPVSAEVNVQLSVRINAWVERLLKLY